MVVFFSCLDWLTESMSEYTHISFLFILRPSASVLLIELMIFIELMIQISKISTYGLNMHHYNYWKLFSFSLYPWYFLSVIKKQLSQTKHSRPANASWLLSSFSIILRTFYLSHLVKKQKQKQRMWCSGFYRHLLESDFKTTANSLFLQVFLQCYYITCGSLLCWLGSFS